MARKKRESYYEVVPKKLKCEHVPGTSNKVYSKGYGFGYAKTDKAAQVIAFKEAEDQRDSGIEDIETSDLCPEKCKRGRVCREKSSEFVREYKTKRTNKKRKFNKTLWEAAALARTEWKVVCECLKKKTKRIR